MERVADTFADGAPWFISLEEVKVKLSHQSFFPAAGFWFLVSLFVFNTTTLAESFPFRSIAPGDPMPALTLTEEGTGKTFTLPDGSGRPLLLLFFGADLPAKKKRSLEALSMLRENLSFLEQHQVRVVVVDAQGDPPATIEELKKTAGLTLPVYLDPSQEAYATLGIYVMPAFLLVDGKGTVVAGSGYSHDLAVRLVGEVQILSGEKTREQLEAELHPVNIEVSATAKKAHRHFNMGKTLFAKGQLESALREFKAAAELDPEMGRAQVEIGCTLLALGRPDEAVPFLEKGLDLDPDLLEGEICLAKINAAQGRVDEAIDDLQSLLFRNSRNPELHFTLGTFYAQKKEWQQAAHSFQTAYELLEKRLQRQE